MTCEVCPASNVALGVYEKPEDVPLRTLFDAGVPMALGADDPLLFGSRLAAQYDTRPRPPCLHGRGAGRTGPAVGARFGGAGGRAAEAAGGRGRLAGGAVDGSEPSGRLLPSGRPPWPCRQVGVVRSGPRLSQARGERQAASGQGCGRGVRRSRRSGRRHVVGERALRAGAQQQRGRGVRVGVLPYPAHRLLGPQIGREPLDRHVRPGAQLPHGVVVPPLELLLGVQGGRDREALLVEQGGLAGDLGEVAPPACRAPARRRGC